MSSAPPHRLTSQNVDDILKACLFQEGEPMTPRIEVTGIMNNFGFHPERIEAHQEDIQAMLSELPDEYFLGKGGGWSFLNLCMTKDGVQWTGLHMVQEQLCALAIAAGWMQPLMPRRIWSLLYGGMPYVTIVDERLPVVITHVVEEEGTPS